MRHEAHNNQATEHASRDHGAVDIPSCSCRVPNHPMLPDNVGTILRSPCLSYNQIHTAIRESVERFSINDDFQPDIMIAIGGLRRLHPRPHPPHLPQKTQQEHPYPGHRPFPLRGARDLQRRGRRLGHVVSDSGSSTPAAPPQPQVTKTQWLNFGGADSLVNLVGRNILIVDEVDDTRQTLAFAVAELVKDIKKQEEAMGLGPGERETKLGVFVLHNKIKKKKMSLPENVMKYYFAAVDMPDTWLVYPWDAVDIDEHTKKAENCELNLSAASHQ
ncbi:hypothetical protein BC936DRAFT_140745 [Jimgerdemannia flammicorona]|uniref:Phosphoribosyltransferase-like protein n=1 Tax=Jimgerdemannia flammicorona TaxID=994334 RepID=A0A433DGR6_9FUNG|nr:hypothetical protein BC936DRAFT_140745 [Jimgerdemannia flammicorona]